jgi:hypothetical protein
MQDNRRNGSIQEPITVIVAVVAVVAVAAVVAVVVAVVVRPVVLCPSRRPSLCPSVVVVVVRRPSRSLTRDVWHTS